MITWSPHRRVLEVRNDRPHRDDGPGTQEAPRRTVQHAAENGELIRDVLVHHNALFNRNFRHLTIGPAEDVTESDNVLFDEPSLADPELEDCLDR